MITEPSSLKDHRYDYIIAGAGLSGLSLAHRLIHSSLDDKKLLIIDENLSPVNDKTWSFWHTEPPPFRNLIRKKWDQIKVIFDDTVISESLEKYHYYSIRSGTFRKHLLNELREHSSVNLLEAPISSLHGNTTKARLLTRSDSYKAKYIFQSCFTPPQLAADTPRYPLIQHFLGIEIETNRQVFDDSVVTLMDFDPGFAGGIAFVYILPWTPERALIEYTIFSDSPLNGDFYREKLNLYLFNKYHLRALDYSIHRTEKGQIPMQDHIYAPYYAPRVLNMGAVGGLTKPSTGYTFSRIQQHVQAVINSLLNNNPPAPLARSPSRYRAYDLWLLQIMHDHPETALQIFRQLFSNNSMDQVFQFLGEENTVVEDLKTMSSVSYRPFFRAIFRTRKRLLQLV